MKLKQNILIIPFNGSFEEPVLGKHPPTHRQPNTVDIRAIHSSFLNPSLPNGKHKRFLVQILMLEYC